MTLVVIDNVIPFVALGVDYPRQVVAGSQSYLLIILQCTIYAAVLLVMNASRVPY